MFVIIQGEIKYDNGVKACNLCGWDENILTIKKDGTVYRKKDKMTLGIFLGFAETIEQAMILEHNLVILTGANKRE